MLIGYNNDVQYRGKTFHIQTEDRGAPSLQIETQIFHAGAILDTRIISYEEIYNASSSVDERNTNIKALMKKTHRGLYRNLFSGKYDEFVGLEPREDAAEVEVEEIEDFTPGQDGVPAAAIELERKGADEVDVASLPGAGDHVNLQSLKSRLAKMSEATEEEPEADGDAATQIIGNLDEIPALSDGGGAKPTEKPLLSLSKKLGEKKNLKAPAAELPSTGVKAWQGCLPATEELSIVDLVEAFLAK